MYIIFKNRIYTSLFSVIIMGLIAFFFVMLNRKNEATLVYKIKQKALHEYVDFDSSMRVNDFPQTVARSDMRAVYDFFQGVYAKTNMLRVVPSVSLKIPRYIHIMWLGGSLPEEYHSYVKSWRTYHPDWTIVFWTDNNINYNQGDIVVRNFNELNHILQKNFYKNIVVDTHDLAFDNRIFYDRAVNYGEKSDILKWEIVYRFGGLWVDTDFECLKSFDLLHHLYDFYTGIQPLDTNIPQLGAALFAARPKHPLLEECVQGIKNNQHIQQIIAKTGPIHFTRVFLQVADKTGLVDVALPASYFYPCGYEQKGMERAIWCKPESFAVHHWAGSWLKPEAFVKT
jgi:inositol phosphorylceramide mannosyltransferase catalytic subunit